MSTNELAEVSQPVSAWRVQSSYAAGTMVVTLTVNNLPAVFREGP